MLMSDPQGKVPFVSVVVIVLNRAKKIGACLDSLVRQTYPKDRFEIVVVDNGSTDGTVEIVKSYPVRLIHEPVRGYSPARNSGVRAARGEMVAFTDSDCMAAPDWIVELVKPFADPKVGVVGGSVQTYSEEPTMVENFIESAGFVGPPQCDMNGIFPFIITANAAYRRKTLVEAGLFNTSLPSCEDVDMSRTVQVMLGQRAQLVPTAIVYHWHRQDVAALVKMMRRNGYGEMIMASRWKDQDPFRTSAAREIRQLTQQFFALFVYAASFVNRSFSGFLKRREVFYRMFPLYYFLAEGANIIGKLEALRDTGLLKNAPGTVYRSRG
jgi:glycosyltransferase involved in cell wall biosynthesis